MIKAGRAGGLLGGLKSGACKARVGPDNGRFQPVRNKFRTWKLSGVTFAQFRYLLQHLHLRRQQGARKPYLRKHELPSKIRLAHDIDAALKLMNGTKFGHPDRFADRVSGEVEGAMRATRDHTFKALLSMAVRFRQSPRGLASDMARGGLVKWKTAMMRRKRARGTYRQTGHTDKHLQR